MPSDSTPRPDRHPRRYTAAWTVALLAAAPHAWLAVASIDGAWSPRMGGWWAAYAVFLLALLADSRRRNLARRTGNGRAELIGIAALALQCLAALMANWLVPTVIPGVATGGALLVITAASMARFPLPFAIAWVAAQQALLLWIYIDAWPTSIALVAGGAYAVFSFVMLSVERMAGRERALRLELMDTLSRLSATHRLLEAGARDAERLRITRDLHDVLGHHLVALSLRLEHAQQIVRPEADAALITAVADARSITRTLLDELRGVVADLRERPVIDLAAALAALASDGPPRISVHADANGHDAKDFEAAEAAVIVRAAQELITNARKHAHAESISVTLAGRTLTVRDDGRGGEIVEGYGLQGIRERLTDIGGTLEFPPGDQGTTARLTLPSRTSHQTPMHARPNRGSQP